MSDVLRVTLSGYGGDVPSDLETVETNWNDLDDDIFRLVRAHGGGELRRLSDAELEHVLDEPIQQLRDEYDPRMYSHADLPDWHSLALGVA